ALHDPRDVRGDLLRLHRPDLRAAGAGDGRNHGKFVLADRARVRHDRVMPAREQLREIAILAYPGVQSLDVTGPLEVFDGARRLIAASRPHEPAYRVRVLAPRGEPVQTSSGLTLVPDAGLQ